VTPKLYKAAEVCDVAQLQPYVLRSWEKEFPGIGVQKPGDAQRLYRQSDVEQVLRIKQLVFTEGLTLSMLTRVLLGVAGVDRADARLMQFFDHHERGADPWCGPGDPVASCHPLTIADLNVDEGGVRDGRRRVTSFRAAIMAIMEPVCGAQPMHW
jgi:hypothetical protein